jgi:hypothetical protein
MQICPGGSGHRAAGRPLGILACWLSRIFIPSAGNLPGDRPSPAFSNLTGEEMNNPRTPQPPVMFPSNGKNKKRLIYGKKGRACILYL